MDELKQLIDKLSDKFEDAKDKELFEETIKELKESGEEITADDILSLYEGILEEAKEVDGNFAKEAEAMMNKPSKAGFLDKLHQKFNNEPKNGQEASHIKDVDMDDFEEGSEGKELDDHAKDLNNAAKSKVKAAKVKNVDGMKESKEESCEAFSKIFEGQDFSDEFKEKAQTILEATFNAKVEEYHTQLDEAVAEILEEEISKIQDSYEDKIDKYLDFIVEGWLEDNVIALESSMKVELAESVFSDIKSVLVQNNITIPEEKVDIVDEIVKENEELKESYNESIDKIIELQESLKKYEKEKAISESVEGLSELEKDEIFKLLEGVEYTDKDSFAKKAGILVEAFSSTSKDTKKILAEDYENRLEESKESTKILKESSNEVGMVVSAMKKTSRKL